MEHLSVNLDRDEMRKVLFAFLLFAGIVCFSGCGGDAVRVRDADYHPVIDAAHFVTEIDNEYWPMAVGRSWHFEGAETIDVTVTDSTKVILGVTCTVVRDQVFENGALVEDTYDWYAQDEAGNVWYFGEDSREMSNGRVVSTEGSWEAGVDGAEPGIVMWNNPVPGIPYRQEYLFGEAEDWAQVVDVLDSLTVGSTVYHDVVETVEWTPLEPGARESKFYAPGVGVIREIGGSDTTDLVP